MVCFAFNLFKTLKILINEKSTSSNESENFSSTGSEGMA